MLVDETAEHLGVLPRMPDEEDRAEAGGEGRLRLLHASLGARDLRRVAREEVVHGLLARELRDRRQNAISIRREEDDVLRVAAAPVRHEVRDVVQWVRRPRVFGDRLVLELYPARDRIEDHILEDRAEHL